MLEENPKGKRFLGRLCWEDCIEKRIFSIIAGEERGNSDWKGVTEKRVKVLEDL